MVNHVNNTPAGTRVPLVTRPLPQALCPILQVNVALTIHSPAVDKLHGPVLLSCTQAKSLKDLRYRVEFPAILSYFPALAGLFRVFRNAVLHSYASLPVQPSPCGEPDPRHWKYSG